MADFTANTSAAERSDNLILRVLRKIWDTLVYIGETNARAQTLKAIAEISDEQLAKQGVTRDELVRRALSDHYQY